MGYYVVVSEQGPGWNPARSMREQEGWGAHATFMNALADERLVLLGGPLKGAAHHRAMLVTQAPSEPALRDRLARDPWMVSGVLRVVSVEPWELLLGELERPGPDLSGPTEPPV
jgi:uncharacterized protein YciI